MTVIEWKAPPNLRPGLVSFDWPAIVSACRARPGEWALIGQDVWSSHQASAKRNGLDARTVKTNKSRCDLYVRWLGEAEPAANQQLPGGGE